MDKVKLFITRSFFEGGQKSYKPGDKIEVDTITAGKWITNGWARPIPSDAKPVENAKANNPAEKATAHKGKPSAKK